MQLKISLELNKNGIGLLIGLLIFPSKLMAIFILDESIRIHIWRTLFSKYNLDRD